ncbi:MAG TPA: hypothetical protein VKU60_19930 [Chloroflexota bacterium]|nr:hypothetical protein [Chloroflexota bacterium]
MEVREGIGLASLIVVAGIITYGIFNSAGSVNILKESFSGFGGLVQTATRPSGAQFPVN